MSALRFLLLLVQLAFGLVVIAGGAWALWVVVAAPIVAALIP